MRTARSLHFRIILYFALTCGLTNCATGSKRLSELDKALTEIQGGRAEQGRGALDNLCKDGVTSACAFLDRSVETKRPVPIMQSLTSDAQSRFAILIPKIDRPAYFLKRAGGKAERLQAERIERSHSGLVVDQIEGFGLNPKDEYELLVVGRDGQLWDRRTFRSLDTAKKRPRLAVVSCLDDSLSEIQEKMWRQLASQKPDAVLMIGDNVYADKRLEVPSKISAEHIWDRYVETRAVLGLFKSNPLIPVFATWDDHDTGSNDSDRTFALKNTAQDTFFAFFPQRRPASGFERGPGLASWWTAFGLQIALLDGRSFRSPNRVDLPDETHFGLDQEKWIQEHLLASKTPVLLISGDQFFGGYHAFESYEGSHPKSFKIQFEQWKKSKVPLLFLSGDRHLTEILKVAPEHLGYSTFEITSSAIHAMVFPHAFKDHPSPHQLVGIAGQYNFTLLELMRSGPGLLQVAVQAFAPDRKLLYQKTLTVKR